jgi:hypothetical protein
MCPFWLRTRCLVAHCTILGGTIDRLCDDGCLWHGCGFSRVAMGALQRLQMCAASGMPAGCASAVTTTLC